VKSNKKEIKKPYKTKEDITHCIVIANMSDRMKKSKRIKEIQAKQINGNWKERKI
jgi:hypothetical protein